MAENSKESTIHRERILERVLRPNFIGAVMASKQILPSKVQLFDACADVSIESKSDEDSVLTMNYGDIAYTFKVDYLVRKEEKERKIVDKDGNEVTKVDVSTRYIVHSIS